MPLTPGSRLGVYDITAQIGEGGMGAVYRATDTSLGRQVAIKVLPDAFAADPERMARFEREAKTLAALNHPNIAEIYGLERSSGTLALVMELVEGDDLSQRIARGAIPLDEALPIAKQIAEALEAAHEQGIIHRDLKPANIKVRSDGTVKVLDFGLAKAMEPAAGSSPSLSMSPTITTPAMTQAGMILGTAAYMSPEQARGKTVDKRADIWAFGCVLFEMLTGQRAFPGEDITDTIVSVVSKEPDWATLPSTIAGSMKALLRRCLDKDPKRRLRDIGEARLALEGPFESAVAQTVPVRAAVRLGRLVWMAFGAVCLVAVALAVLAFRHLRETPPPAPFETRLEIATPATDAPSSFAISPDGRRLVFVALVPGGRSQLWLRSLDQITGQPLPGTDGATYPFWSPDSRSVAFFGGGQLKRLDIGLGALQTLTAAPNGRGGTWGPDNIILFSPTQFGAVLKVAATGGEATAVTTLALGQTSHRAPQFLPGGRQFLFFAAGAEAVRGIYLGSLDSPTTKRLIVADTAGAFAPQGWLLFLRQGALAAERLDRERGELLGDPVAVADAVGFDPNAAIASLSVSASGALTLRRGQVARRQLIWFDRSGKQLGEMGAPDDANLIAPSLSPDGRRVVVERTVDHNTDIWLLDGARMTRLTFDPGVDRFPTWARDGSRVVFDSTRKGNRNLYQKALDGGGADELFLETPLPKSGNDWSADGRYFLYRTDDPKTGSDLWILPLTGDRKPFPFVNTAFDERTGQFSPDGRWVAYQSNESGTFQIYVRPFPGSGKQWQVSTAGGVQPRWRRDGKELYYIDPSGKLMAVPLLTRSEALVQGDPVGLFQTRIWGGGTNYTNRQQYDVAPDGRFLSNVALEDTGTAPITVIQNWQPDAKK